MNKETKRAAAMIEDRKKQWAATIQASTQAIQDKTTKRDILQAQLATAATEDEYTALCRDLRDIESGIEFHKKRMQFAEKQGVLSKDEEKAVIAQLDKAEQSINAETAGEIQATVSKLFTLLAVRAKDFEELNKLVIELNSLNPSNNKMPYNAATYPQYDKRVTECTNTYFRVTQQELAGKGLLTAGEVKS